MRIFIAEDQVKLATNIKKGLQYQGFAVDWKENGTDALNHLVVHHSYYDVIILDLMLPGSSGEDICAELRKRKVSVPILILTAKNASTDKVSLLNAGADDYLSKPFSFVELVARLQALMRRPEKV
jgi:DNA-binding response OmpR family regulator